MYILYHSRYDTAPVSAQYCDNGANIIPVLAQHGHIMVYSNGFINLDIDYVNDEFIIYSMRLFSCIKALLQDTGSQNL